MEDFQAQAHCVASEKFRVDIRKLANIINNNILAR
jgi:hypothetical protein